MVNGSGYNPSVNRHSLPFLACYLHGIEMVSPSTVK